MKKIVTLFLGGMLLLSLSACSSNTKQETDNTNLDQTDRIDTETQTPESEETNIETEVGIADEVQIQVEGREGQNIIFQLNNSPAANALYEQLPLSIWIEDYGHNEKIFYPPQELDISDTPPAQGATGTLAYYAPWGDVVFFYGEYEGGSSLYELGEAVSGAEQIESLSGEIQIHTVSGD